MIDNLNKKFGRYLRYFVFVGFYGNRFKVLLKNYYYNRIIILTETQRKEEFLIDSSVNKRLILQTIDIKRGI